MFGIFKIFQDFFEICEIFEDFFGLSTKMYEIFASCSLADLERLTPLTVINRDRPETLTIKDHHGTILKRKNIL